MAARGATGPDPARPFEPRGPFRRGGGVLCGTGTAVWTGRVGWCTPWSCTPWPYGPWGTCPGRYPTPPCHPAALLRVPHRGRRAPRKNGPLGSRARGGAPCTGTQGIHGNTREYREYTGIHGNTGNTREHREYTGIHGNTGFWPKEAGSFGQKEPASFGQKSQAPFDQKSQALLAKSRRLFLAKSSLFHRALLAKSAGFFWPKAGFFWPEVPASLAKSRLFGQRTALRALIRPTALRALLY